MLFFPQITRVFHTFAIVLTQKARIMALKDWMIAFNNAKTMETNGEEGLELIEEYERVLSLLGKGPFTEAEENVRKEVYRNLYELYALNENEEKAEEYKQLSEWLFPFQHIKISIQQFLRPNVSAHSLPAYIAFD